MVQLILWALLILFPVSVQATTYYVATTGNDANSGTSEASPKLTVRHCVSIMVAGDTCLVRGGTYTETSTIRFGKTGTQSAPIRLAAYPNESPSITWATQTSNDRILLENSAGDQVGIGWITIEGLEIHHGYNGIKFASLHNATIKNNWIHDTAQSSILGIGGHHVVIDRNIINHNGPIATDPTSTLSHGLYMHGSDMTISNNLIYDNLGYGIQQNGSSTSLFNATIHPSADFANAYRWIVVNNTIAYNINRAGIVVWGSGCSNSRYENNIIYENATTLSTGSLQGIDCVGCSGSTGISIKNNHLYASGSGGQVGIDTTFNADLVSSGNVTNVSSPAFVNGGSNALPGSPDFRLTANAPVNIALANEFPNNSTNVVGAFKTVASPICSITANRVTCTYASVTPIRNLSATGVTIGCTGSACPGSPTASTVQNIAGTDAQLETVVSGIAGNACVATNQTWTKTYNSSTGTWTGGDNIGPYPGLNQKMFSFTSLAVTNACTGSGPPPTPGTPYIEYLFTDGTGTTVTNTGSLGASGNGTLSSGVTWGTGSVTMTGGTSQSLSIPYGNLVDPSATDLTISFLVDLPAGQESLAKTLFGAPLDGAPIEERFYTSMLGNTLRLGIQTNSDGTATDLATNAGLMHVCLIANATTNTVTLHKNGVASAVAGGVRGITSYNIQGNFQLGLLPGLTNGPTATYSHFKIYNSVEDCNALYQAAIAPPATPSLVFSQTAVRYENIYTSSVGVVDVLSSVNSRKKLAQGGAIAVVVQIECNSCTSSFRLAARDNGTGAWLQVPSTETAANVYMFGGGPGQYLNNGSLSTRILANGCTVTDGVTLSTAAQIPTLTLPASGCTMLRYLIRARAGASGYTELRIEQEGGVAFTGSYALGRLDFISPRMGGTGF